MSDAYLLPAEEVRRELTVSNSRFITTLAPVSSVDEAKAFVARIRKEFADASHNVPAYIIGGGNSITEYCGSLGFAVVPPRYGGGFAQNCDFCPNTWRPPRRFPENQYCSDDGEPSGTAGRPALAVLRGSGLGDVAVVVTRYFGGTLLGKGGLVKAYTEATQLAVQAVPRAQRIPVHVVMLVLPYPLLERVRLLVSKHHGEITNETFATDVTMTLRFPVDEFTSFQNALLELSAGSLQGEVIETTEMLVKVQE